MNKIIIVLVVFVILFLNFVNIANAAVVRGNDTVSFDEQASNQDVYLFGGTVIVSSPIQEDLTVAGGNITIDEKIGKDILMAGGNIALHGNIGESARIAGGNITIDAPISRDLIVTGGSVTLTRKASVSGDIIFAGGNIIINAPVKGSVTLNGGEAQINSAIDGDVSGNIGHLTLGNNTFIGGNLSYSSSEQARILEGAVIRGEHDFKRVEGGKDGKEKFGALVGIGAVYKLVMDIVFGLVLVYLLRQFTSLVISRIHSQPFISGLLGFSYLILGLFGGLILFITIWLGFVSLLLYFLALLLGMGFGIVFLGWLVMKIWEERNSRKYTLDWKAPVVGGMLMFVLSLIPIIGWLVGFVVYLLALGGLTKEAYEVIRGSQGHARK